MLFSRGANYKGKDYTLMTLVKTLNEIYHIRPEMT